MCCFQSNAVMIEALIISCNTTKQENVKNGQVKHMLYAKSRNINRWTLLLYLIQSSFKQANV